MVKHMMKNSAEEVSMLMDDEVDEHSRARIIRKLHDDAGMKSCWERYHLISEALRNNLPEIIDPADNETASLTIEMTAESGVSNVTGDGRVYLTTTDYEGCSEEIPEDLNGDCRVDIADLGKLSLRWLDESEPLP